MNQRSSVVVGGGIIRIEVCVDGLPRCRSKVILVDKRERLRRFNRETVDETDASDAKATESRSFRGSGRAAGSPSAEPPRGRL